MKTNAIAAVAALPLLVLFAPIPSCADWQPNGVPVAVAKFAQTSPQSVSDGAGGAIFAWTDTRANGVREDIYAQRVDAAGNTLWPSGGVAIATGVSVEGGQSIASDGAGGAIITWSDALGGIPNDLYAQRIDTTGAILWTPNGVAVCTAANSQQRASVVSDGAGGAFISWQDNRGATGYDIYTQRLSAVGAPQWAADGVQLIQAALDQIEPVSVPDGLGGVRVTWQDRRAGGDSDLYTRRISGNGIPQGSAAGTQVTSPRTYTYAMSMAFDGDQGAIIVWTNILGGNNDIYAQRIDASGNRLWAAGGVAICDMAGKQGFFAVASDGVGSAIIAWEDERQGGPDALIYAQRVNESGAVQWTNGGVQICSSNSNQNRVKICSDAAGGAIVTWRDYRNLAFPEIYAQRINAVGALQWSVDGVLVTAGPNLVNSALVADGSGGAIAAFHNDVSASADVFAQRVEGRYGEWGRPEPSVDSVTDAPGDQGGQVVVRWFASQRDKVLNPLISHYSIWRSTDISAKQAQQRDVLESPNSLPLDFEGEALWKDANEVGTSFWEWVANQDASYQQSYSILASTRENGTPHSFKVLAHDSPTAPSRIWESSAASGQSVDNLAPAAPLALVAVRDGSDVQLYWDNAPEPDLRDYMIYRSNDPGVSPSADNFLGSSLGSMSVDAGAPPTALYYVVTASDVNANEGPASNVASVPGVTAVSGPTAIGSTLSLRQNSPNPFTTSTQLQLSLPSASDVQVEIYDVAGRRVRVMHIPRTEAGWHAIALSGKDDEGKPLASGVYFYRVSAGGMTASEKMLIVR